MKTKLIGVAGPPGAGKSTVTKLIASENPNVLRIKLDNYSYDPEGFPKIDDNPHWDVQGSLDFDLLIKNLSSLNEGNSTDIPLTSFDNGKFKRMHQTVVPKSVVFVEGFLLFLDERVRNLFDIKIYIDIPERKIMERRKGGETLERIKFIQDTLIPNYKEYGESAKQYADHTLDGTLPVEELKKKILKIIVNDSARDATNV